LPVPVRSNAAMLLALMVMVSLPAPALRTAIPPLPIRVSLPAPAAQISSLLVPTKISTPPLPGKSEVGKSYVIFGKTNTNAIDLTKLNSDSKYANKNFITTGAYKDIDTSIT
jgi:hypothetical protein